MSLRSALTILLTNFMACTSLDESSFNNPPEIISISAPTKLGIQDTIRIQVYDPEGDEVSLESTCFIADDTPIGNPWNKIPSDDGQSGDKLAGDGIFTAVLNRGLLQATLSSKFTFDFEVSDDRGSSGRSIEILQNPNSGHAPVLSSLIAPDTVYLAATTVTFTMSVVATDEDGEDDVQTVVLITSSGNAIEMFDDGSPSNGDVSAGDHRYSRIFSLPPSTTPGSYLFKFKATDIINLSSNELQVTVIVSPQQPS